MAEWISKDGELSLVPDFLTKLKPPIDAIFQTINVTLDLLQSILSFVKNFLIDFTQPIKIIIDLLIAQLKALLLDLKQLGVYFTSDADLIPEIKTSGLEPFGDGYSGFEARMVKKLTDISDPTRPNFSTASGTLSLFVVGSADFTNIIIVINAVMKLVDLFLGNFSDSPLPNPNNLKGTIKNGFLPVNIKTAKEYDGIKITWDISPPPNPKGSFFPSFVTPPASFLIHVRTRPTAWYA
ncbi:hypothetical protein EB001_23230, partial [bacterium]|nr:hypothetical protein [bacterium]